MPQSVIGNLRAILGIETGQFESGLKSAQGKLGGFGKGRVPGAGRGGAGRRSRCHSDQRGGQG